MTKKQATYVDGFVLVVPKKRVAEYRAMARDGGRIWMKSGALEYKECQLDDATPTWVTFTFPKMAKAKPNETVWFSYIVFKSKKHRDLVNANVMKEMEKRHGEQGKKQMENMPFDMKRMAYGGFKVVVSN